MTNRTLAIALAAVVSLVLVLPGPTFSARQTLRIEYVSVDALNNTVTISGQNFGTTPVVIFAGTELTVDVYDINSGTISATMPPGPLPGNYLIEIMDERGHGDSFVASVLP